MPSCPYCQVRQESSPPSIAAEHISKHVRECPLNPSNQREKK